VVDGRVPTAQIYGYWMSQHHENDFYGPDNEELALDWFSYLQNHTDTIITLTMGQLNDLWNNRLVYYIDDGIATYDLSTCRENHRVYIDKDNGAPLLWDLTEDALAPACSVEGNEVVAFLSAGHVYSVIGDAVIDADSEGSVQLTDYDAVDANPLASVTANLSEGELAIYIYDVDSGSSYQVLVDGEGESQLLYANDNGTLVYTYDGDWSSHTFVFEPSYLTELTGVFTAVFAAVIVISIMMGLIGLVAGSSRKKK
jgi:hypothetical protein